MNKYEYEDTKEQKLEISEIFVNPEKIRLQRMKTRNARPISVSISSNNNNNNVNIINSNNNNNNNNNNTNNSNNNTKFHI